MLPPLLALLSWPLISVAFFRKLRLPLAILVTIIGGSFCCHSAEASTFRG